MILNFFHYWAIISANDSSSSSMSLLCRAQNALALVNNISARKSLDHRSRVDHQSILGRRKQFSSRWNFRNRDNHARPLFLFFVFFASCTTAQFGLLTFFPILRLSPSSSSLSSSVGIRFRSCDSPHRGCNILHSGCSILDSGCDSAHSGCGSLHRRCASHTAALTVHTHPFKLTPTAHETTPSLFVYWISVLPYPS